MAYVVVAARLPKKDEKKLEEVMAAEGLDRSGAVRSMIELGVSEWRLTRGLSLLRDGKASIGKAAETAGVSLHEMIEAARFRKIAFVHVREGETEEELENLE